MHFELESTISYVQRYHLVYWFIAVQVFWSCTKEDAPNLLVENNQENAPLNLGNLTNATTNTTQAHNYLIHHYAYTIAQNNQISYSLSYNNQRRIPNWIAWHFQGTDKGLVSRQDDFREDTKLPTGWYRVNETSYTGSGFDRGHNCPSADRTASIEANSGTFIMTNIIPQAPDLNRGVWADLEQFIRDTVSANDLEVYTFMGNYGQGGYNSSNSLTNTIDNGNITVPAYVWKVVVFLERGEDDLTRMTKYTRTLTVVMPNNNVPVDWREYITSINNLEKQSAQAGLTLSLSLIHI